MTHVICFNNKIQKGNKKYSSTEDSVYRGIEDHFSSCQKRPGMEFVAFARSVAIARTDLKKKNRGLVLPGYVF